jgi:hypothetical protein
MNRPPTHADPFGSTAHVWSELSRDLQQRAVRLLTQLAYAQLRTHAPSSVQENHHGYTLPNREDSPRSS